MTRLTPRLLLFTLALLFVAPAIGLANEAKPAEKKYLEGVEYVEFRTPMPVESGAKVEVREIFWYGCPHCYQLEPTMERWVKTLPANVHYLRTAGAQWTPTYEAHGRAYYALEAMGLVEKYHMALFEALHVQGLPLTDENGIARFLAGKGMNEAEFRKAFSSFGVTAKIKAARQYVDHAGIRSVPTIIVDGRYLTTSTQTGGHDDLVRVVEFLVKKAEAERAAKAKKK